MKFYDCSTAPSPRLVRMFIAEKGLDIPAEQIDLRTGQHLTPEFLAVNPHGTVPVLVLDDGTRLTSTQGCWRYLEEIRPDPPLLGSTPEEKALIAEAVWRIETDGWAGAQEALRNAAPGLKDRALTGPDNYAQIPELAERGKLRMRRYLDRLDAMLKGRDYVVGDRFSAADILLLVVVDFARWVKLALPDDAANARRWYDTVSSRPSAKL